ncbi:hypothetical protein GALMADRAFT_58610 [Galerina marginata CBS 339.88]|uniref:BTB domain-containing protein n=1 Tax=Galerina marginata (strain CBS 339.88) TaxID=685588 RepID=A0A067TPH9_GALM3|nr:hypothetical protein GALMADRAFT_58610 [Galerina marginata CBS 339.88]
MTEEPTASYTTGASKGKGTDLVQRDDEYYMESNFVVFQVENKLFRIPTYLLAKESQFFGGMFMLPPPAGDDVEGSSPTNPIILPDEFRSEDFKNLMKALYPKSISLRLSLLKSEWVSILKLSTKWYFLKLRAMAILELNSMQELTSIEKITLGRENKILSWVTAGFLDLAQREATITDDEALAVDLNYITTAYRLFRVRERRITKMSASVLLEIEENFKNELDAIRTEEKGFKGPDVEIAFEFTAPIQPWNYFEDQSPPSPPSIPNTAGSFW